MAAAITSDGRSAGGTAGANAQDHTGGTAGADAQDRAGAAGVSVAAGVTGVDRENRGVAAALAAFLLFLLVRVFAEEEYEVKVEEDACPHAPFYAADEVPVVHEIDLLVEKEAFTAYVERMWDRNQPELPMDITFDGVQLVGAKVQLHGGPFQRGSEEPGAGGFNPMGAGGSCRMGGTTQIRDGSDGLPVCKPGLRLNFNKHSKLTNDPRLWGHPVGLAGCGAPDKVVLRSEWNDAPMMIRNKLSTDLYNKLGSPVVRVEYARLSVGGTYWGLFTLEEHLDADFLECRRMPVGDPGTALCNCTSNPNQRDFQGVLLRDCLVVQISRSRTCFPGQSHGPVAICIEIDEFCIQIR